MIYYAIIKRKIKFKLFLRIVIIIFILFHNYFHKNYSAFIGNINYIKEFNKIEDYLKLCNNKLIKIKKIKKYKEPKISIISPIYNRGKYLQRFIKSIQNQNFKEIEIILIDDCSTDKTNSLIKKYQLDDKRIILIQNKKNKGTFASRNLGTLKSKGEYILFPDPDDILDQNCLHFFYHLAKKNDYELIRFYIYLGKKKIYFLKEIHKIPSKSIYQPQLSTYIFYAKKHIFQIDFNVSNKFIKRETLIKTLNYISNNLFLYITRFEDGILNYLLYRVSKSFFFSKKIAYYYIINRDSITTKKYKISDLKCTFLYLKFIFEYSKNTKYEKNMFNTLFRRIVIRRNVNRRIKLINNDFSFYIDIIDEFLGNDFITNKNKIYLVNMRNEIIKGNIKLSKSFLKTNYKKLNK